MSITIADLKARAEKFRQDGEKCRQDGEKADNSAKIIEQFVALEGAELILGQVLNPELLGLPELVPAVVVSGKKRGRPVGYSPKAAKAAKKAAKKAPKAPKTVKPTKKASRVKGQPSLKTLILEVLNGQSEGLDLSQIVQAILSKGYKSSAQKFANVVYQNLYALQNKEKKVESKDHKYTLKAA